MGFVYLNSQLIIYFISYFLVKSSSNILKFLDKNGKLTFLLLILLFELNFLFLFLKFQLYPLCSDIYKKVFNYWYVWPVLITNRLLMTFKFGIFRRLLQILLPECPNIVVSKIFSVSMNHQDPFLNYINYKESHTKILKFFIENVKIFSLLRIKVDFLRNDVIYKRFIKYLIYLSFLHLRDLGQWSFFYLCQNIARGYCP